MQDVLGYSGKRVIVSGAASGMGAATAELLVELGAEVHAVDIKKPDVSGLASFTETDLREPTQVDDAVAKIGAVVDALFNCAGLPNTFSNLDVMLVNFCGLRHLTERVVPNIVEGGAIASIASSAGIGWLMNMETLGGLLNSTAGAIPQSGDRFYIGGLELTVVQRDDRRVRLVRIARPKTVPPPAPKA